MAEQSRGFYAGCSKNKAAPGYQVRFLGYKGLLVSRLLRLLRQRSAFDTTPPKKNTQHQPRSYFCRALLILSLYLPYLLFLFVFPVILVHYCVHPSVFQRRIIAVSDFLLFRLLKQASDTSPGLWKPLRLLRRFEGGYMRKELINDPFPSLRFHCVYCFKELNLRPLYRPL